MTALRSATVTVEVEFTVEARATEGEMVDAIHAAVVNLVNLGLSKTPILPNSRIKLAVTGTHVVTNGVGGSSL